MIELTRERKEYIRSRLQYDDDALAICLAADGMIQEGTPKSEVMALISCGRENLAFDKTHNQMIWDNTPMAQPDCKPPLHAVLDKGTTTVKTKDPFDDFDNKRPKHYQAPFDTAQVQEYVFQNVYNALPDDKKHLAAWALEATGYLLRAGLKGPVLEDIHKAKDTLHRIETGEWLKG